MFQSSWPMVILALLVCNVKTSLGAGDGPAPGATVIRSAQSGPWSQASTWEGGTVPKAGARVLIRAGHQVVYDMHSEVAIRGINVAGVLSFATDRDTRLDVGLITIQAAEEYTEIGFDCEKHLDPPEPGKPRPALTVGTVSQPVEADHSALIRLLHFEGMDPESCPAIVCCGGQMEFHGSPLNRTWVKLGQPANRGDREILLNEPVTGWRVGDRIILTATTRQNKVKKTFRPSTRDSTQTEERSIAAIEGTKLTLDQPLEFDHTAQGNYRADVANLSRNVIVESANPEGVRGHTMFHRYSTGGISYAEFRHLGKREMLGRYSLHFHLVGDTMRGSSVIGASIWDSHNRWLTIHGTNYLVVRDCVGYQSVGHGFFLEDGTEVYNVLDRNLAVQAYIGKPLPKQVLPFDKNDGSGFWWANCHNFLTRNVACECDEYGYFFQAAKTPDFDPVLSIQQPDGSEKSLDIRTLPFVRFEDNESHCQRRHGFNLGGGVPFGKPNVDGVGPDDRHPFIIRNLRLWNVHWAIHPVSPTVMLDGLDIFNAEYGVWRPEYKQHVYRNLHMDQVPEKLQYAFVSGSPGNDEAKFPSPLDPVDDLPPVTVITRITRDGDRMLVRGTTLDNNQVSTVLVNGQPAKAIEPNFSEWEAQVAFKEMVTASAIDSAGNQESRPHELKILP